MFSSSGHLTLRSCVQLKLQLSVTITSSSLNWIVKSLELLSTVCIHIRAWTQTPRDQSGIGPVKFPLVSDFSKETARAYGVLDDESGAAHRGLFIIDPEGVLRYQVVTDMNVGRSVDETLRVLQALQAGGLCPANWKPGDKTL